MIVSLIGAEANGGPSDDGATYDGVAPVRRGRHPRLEPRLLAARPRLPRDGGLQRGHGVPLPHRRMDDRQRVLPRGRGSCEEFGARAAEYFADLPNIVWVMGGDYFPATDDLAEGSDVDHCMDNALRGIRSTGDTRPFSIQLGYDKSVSTENPFWAARVDWNFVYTYYPTYAAVLEAYRAADKPALFSEGNYEGENNQPDTPPTTDETLRRQALWALTSGSPGEFYGSQDWRFEDGWQGRLESRAPGRLQGIRDFFRTLPWWRLEPDDQRPVVTGGRGTGGAAVAMDVLDSDYVTAAAPRTAVRPWCTSRPAGPSSRTWTGCPPGPPPSGSTRRRRGRLLPP